MTLKTNPKQTHFNPVLQEIHRDYFSPPYALRREGSPFVGFAEEGFTASDLRQFVKEGFT